MERAAKERLIGAVVLVTAAWLLIPVFLDQRPARDGAVVSRDLALPERAATGDGAPAMRRETIDLRQDARPAVPDGDEAQPVAALPAPSAPSDSASGSQPDDDAERERADEPPAIAVEKQPAEIAEKPPELTAAPEQPASTQPVGEVPLVTDERASPPATQMPRDGGSDQLWAVQLGSFSDKANAQRLAAKFRAEGLPAFISEVSQDGRTLHRVRIGPQGSRGDAEGVLRRVTAGGQAASVVAHP